MLATTISYLDRQTLSIVQPVILKQYHMTNSDYSLIVSAFLLAYGIFHPFMGRFIDWISTRRGFAISIVAWSLAGIAHAFAGGVASFAVMRFMLGTSEAGNFPAAAKTVAEWFPDREKTVATGIFNMGAGLGAVIAPPLITFITLHYGWQHAFIVTGSLGFFWVIAWLLLYHPPEKHPRLTPEELIHIRSGQDEEQPTARGAERSVVVQLLSCREMWGLMIARGLTDPVWFFYLFWLPGYLATARHFDLKQIGLFAWVPFLAADLGSILGGILSAYFVKRGFSIINARKATMCIAAVLMPAALPAVRAESPALAIFLISIATFGHQFWAAGMLTLPADLFPKRMVASAYGIPAACGTFAGMGFTALVGWLLDHYTRGYISVFTIAGCMHPLAALTIVALIKSPRGKLGATVTNG
jgi:ACS family hexuronate transporter-like MFS transporter